MLAGFTVKSLGIWLLATPVMAHMAMIDPPPFHAKNNPNANGDVDYDLVAPLSAATFPCKGYQSLLGSPAGAPVATWKAGSEQSFTVAGGAPHQGGSCQVSLSFDRGKSFTVIHSYIGGCPETAPESTFSFRVPSDTPSSDDALLSWSWINKVGNLEFYQNCAPIVIDGGNSGGEDMPFHQRPAMFTANLGDGCTTVASADVMIPDPGPDVDMNNPDAVAPVGNCGASGSSPPVSGGLQKPSQVPGDQPAGSAPGECTCVSGGTGDKELDSLVPSGHPAVVALGCLYTMAVIMAGAIHFVLMLS